MSKHFRNFVCSLVILITLYVTGVLKKCIANVFQDQYLLSVWLLLLCHNYTVTLKRKNPCKATALDFVFVIDSSRSIRPEDYDKVKTFIINLLQFLDVGLNSTRVGLLQYGSVVQPEFSLNTHTSKAQVEEAVRNMQHLATGTMTGLAIQYTMEVAFTEEQGARPKSLQIPRIAMIVTDGRPQDTVEEIAAEAREAGIQIFAIGVGRVEMKTLKAIGSQPHSEHVHLVANFSQIETLISVFKSKLCGDMCKVVEHQCQHICVSSPASYRCRCRKGFTLNPDGKTCKGESLTVKHFQSSCSEAVSDLPPCCLSEAEDMCAAADHGCDHICVNLADGYECRCRPGYELTIDLKTSFIVNSADEQFHQVLIAAGIDYCDLGNHGCEHNCVSLPGSYICSCMKGFLLAEDGKTCENKPADESLCRCESVIVFQNQVTEKLKNLAQSNILLFCWFPPQRE
uniref:VWFA domain-containing protein n=1 Tax=Poecilia mexicana TaxID=48701 RepID=A0A3B3XNV2_9TELE